MRLSLRRKWALVMLVVALVPLVGLAVLAVQIQRAGLRVAEQELEMSVVDHASGEIEQHLRAVVATTHRVGALLGDPRIPEELQQLLVLDALHDAFDVSSVAVFDRSGGFIDAIEAQAGDAAAATRSLPRLPLAPTWLAPEEGAPLYIEPIGADPDVRGYVSARINAMALREILRAIGEARFGERGRIALVDRDLRVIAESSPTTASASPRFGGGRMPAEGIAESVELRERDGARLVGTIRTLPHRALAVVVERPEADAYAALGAARTAFVAASIVFAGLAAAVGALFAARTTRPILSLVELARRYGARELTEKSSVRTGDELEVLGDALSQMAQNILVGENEISRRAAVETNLSRFMPAPVAASIAEGKAPLALGGERKDVSVVFADVASFTTFAESSPPEAVTAFLNELFSVLSELVFRNRGIVDKFVGDCIMAVLLADDSGEHAVRAVACAEDMQRFVAARASDWRARFGIDVRLGIGVSTGEAVVGNLGSEARMEYTAIGDVVNVASRLEGLARPGQVLVTQSVVDAAGAAFSFLSLGDHVLRGKQGAIEILELAE